MQKAVERWISPKPSLEVDIPDSDEEQQKDGPERIFQLVLENALGELRELLHQSVNPDWQSPAHFNFSALHWAAENDQPECVQLLLKARASVNVRSIHGLKPMAMAAPNSIGFDLLKAADSGRAERRAVALRFSALQGFMKKPPGADTSEAMDMLFGPKSEESWRGAINVKGTRLFDQLLHEVLATARLRFREAARLMLAEMASGGERCVVCTLPLPCHKHNEESRFKQLVTVAQTNRKRAVYESKTVVYRSAARIRTSAISPAKRVHNLGAHGGWRTPRQLGQNITGSFGDAEVHTAPLPSPRRRRLRSRRAAALGSTECKSAADQTGVKAQWPDSSASDAKNQARGRRAKELQKLMQDGVERQMQREIEERLQEQVREAERLNKAERSMRKNVARRQQVERWRSERMSQDLLSVSPPALSQEKEVCWMDEVRRLAEQYGVTPRVFRRPTPRGRCREKLPQLRSFKVHE